MIPKLLHQIWLGKNAIPLSLRDYSETWKEKHREWEHILWNDITSYSLVETRFPCLLPLYEKAPYLTQRVDIIKYLILFEFGGIYIDFDCECLKSINDLLTHPICLGLEPREENLHQEFPVFLGSAFMAATPNTSFF